MRLLISVLALFLMTGPVFAGERATSTEEQPTGSGAREDPGELMEPDSTSAGTLTDPYDGFYPDYVYVTYLRDHYRDYGPSDEAIHSKLDDSSDTNAPWDQVTTDQFKVVIKAINGTPNDTKVRVYGFLGFNAFMVDADLDSGRAETLIDQHDLAYMGPKVLLIASDEPIHLFGDVYTEARRIVTEVDGNMFAFSQASQRTLDFDEVDCQISSTLCDLATFRKPWLETVPFTTWD